MRNLAVISDGGCMEWKTSNKYFSDTALMIARAGAYRSLQDEVLFSRKYISGCFSMSQDEAATATALSASAIRAATIFAIMALSNKSIALSRLAVVKKII